MRSGPWHIAATRGRPQVDPIAQGKGVALDSAVHRGVALRFVARSSRQLRLRIDLRWSRDALALAANSGDPRLGGEHGFKWTFHPTTASHVQPKTQLSTLSPVRATIRLTDLCTRSTHPLPWGRQAQLSTGFTSHDERNSSTSLLRKTVPLSDNNCAGVRESRTHASEQVRPPQRIHARVAATQ